MASPDAAVLLIHLQIVGIFWAQTTFERGEIEERKCLIQLLLRKKKQNNLNQYLNFESAIISAMNKILKAFQIKYFNMPSRTYAFSSAASTYRR